MCKKYSIINFCLKNKKNFLVEKPLNFSKNIIKKINSILKSNKNEGYVAFNHRFEPNIIKLKKLLNKRIIGQIYSFKIYYGNGTAKLVKKSWREKKKGIQTDLGSHIIDIAIYLLGKKNIGNLKNIFERKLENKNPDHIFFSNKNSKIKIDFEASYCSWKNKFYIEIVGKKGSFYLYNLCKWGASTLYQMTRVLPSGKPHIKKFKKARGDKTWQVEQKYFEKPNID